MGFTSAENILMEHLLWVRPLSSAGVTNINQTWSLPQGQWTKRQVVTPTGDRSLCRKGWKILRVPRAIHMEEGEVSPNPGTSQQPLQGGLGWNPMNKGEITGTRNYGACGALEELLPFLWGR